MYSKKIVEILATFFYLGKLPKMPGTFGTLGAVPLWYLLAKTGPIPYMNLTVLILIASLFICEFYEQSTRTHDNKEVVLDEVVGYLITMTWVPVNPKSAVLGFALFRFFDVLKPFPINKLDEKIKGGVGVVVDDVAAGLISNIILQFYYGYFS